MMNRPISKVAASMLAIAAMQAAGSAHAADAAAADAAADASAESTGDSSGLTDIVVTATKRETNLQKTPIAIAVLGADVIEKRHVQSLLDLADGGALFDEVLLSVWSPTAASPRCASRPSRRASPR